MPSAAGRLTTNQGAISALTAAAPNATHPAPLTAAASRSCTGVAATAQPYTPMAVASAPAKVVAATPQRR